MKCYYTDMISRSIVRHSVLSKGGSRRGVYTSQPGGSSGLAGRGGDSASRRIMSCVVEVTLASGVNRFIQLPFAGSPQVHVQKGRVEQHGASRHNKEINKDVASNERHNHLDSAMDNGDVEAAAAAFMSATAPAAPATSLC